MNNELMCKASSKLACIGSKIGRFGSTGIFTIKKFSPEILTFLGVTGIVTATIMIARETYLNAHRVIDEHNDMIGAIKEARELNSPEYTDKQIKQDIVSTYINTGKSFAVVYGPGVAVGLLSLGCLVGSSLILKKRNLAIAAAYSLIEKAFNEYRGRVVEELGNEKDFHFRYGTEYETITEEITDEAGKVKKVKKQVQVLKNNAAVSMYARVFEEQQYNTADGTYTGSSQWSNNADYNVTNLILKNGWANDQLRARGYLFLNDVYEELGFPRTKAGQLVGWLWRGNGDQYVSFGPEIDALMRKMPRPMAYRDGNSFLLDFNVDGVILENIDGLE